MAKTPQKRTYLNVTSSLPTQMLQKMALKQPKRTAVPDLVREGTFAEPNADAKPCTRAVKKPAGWKKGDPWDPKPMQKLRPCHIELVLIGKGKVAQRYGNPPPGAYLRACSTWAGKVTLIPVKDHDDAMKKSKAFCACRKKSPADVCTAKVSKR